MLPISSIASSSQIGITLVEWSMEDREAVMQLVTGWLEGEQRHGRHEEARDLVLRQLEHRLGRLERPLKRRVRQLSLAQIEALGEALLDFAERSELDTWLEQRR